MPSDSTKTLVDLCGEGLFSVGWVKNQQFLFPAKKAVDVRWEEVDCTLGLGMVGHFFVSCDSHRKASVCAVGSSIFGFTASQMTARSLTAWGLVSVTLYPPVCSFGRSVGLDFFLAGGD